MRMHTKAGDWIIKAGPISVQPSVDSDPIDVAGLQTFENGVDVDNDDVQCRWA